MKIISDIDAIIFMLIGIVLLALVTITLVREVRKLRK
jgi:glycopeptide antibiotics resistance protein